MSSYTHWRFYQAHFLYSEFVSVVLQWSSGGPFLLLGGVERSWHIVHSNRWVCNYTPTLTDGSTTHTVDLL